MQLNHERPRLHGAKVVFLGLRLKGVGTMHLAIQQRRDIGDLYQVIWHVVKIMVPFGSLICHGLSILGTQDGTILELAMATGKTHGFEYVSSLEWGCLCSLPHHAGGTASVKKNPVNPPSLQIPCYPKTQQQEVRNSGTKVREVRLRWTPKLPRFDLYEGTRSLDLRM